MASAFDKYYILYFASYAMRLKKGQVSIFVIVALVIVGAVIVFFVVRDQFGLGVGRGEFQPVFDYYQSCIEREISNAVELAGLQGGFVRDKEFLPGSNYAPFSSHLHVLGVSVPYWYTLSANGLIVEDVPTVSEIEQDMADYIETQLATCDFSTFEAQGIEVDRTYPDVQLAIGDREISAQVRGSFSATREGVSSRTSSMSATTTSSFGLLHRQARSLYDLEKTSAFMEAYSVDALRTYAPVDGVSISCAPAIWKTQEVVSDIRGALAENIASLRFGTSGDYFSVDSSTTVPVRALYDADWPSVIEVTPADASLMIAEPVGNQPGLGVMGFCYVPYHFVYDVRFPVLFQLYDGETLFQFPVVVIIDNNLPRAALTSDFSEGLETNVCAFATNEVTIATYDSDLNALPARVSYQCFDNQCSVGESVLTEEGALLDALLPSCVNGYLRAEAEGYASVEKVFSSTSENYVELILSPLYDVQLEVIVGGIPFNGTAIVQFSSGDVVASAAYPETRSVSLTEGLYNVSVYAYGTSGITIPASTSTECRNIPKPGLAGFFGGTSEECFEITIPESKIEQALAGGGRSTVYLFEHELQNGRLRLSVDSFGIPNSLEDVQYGYEALQSSSVEVSI